MTIRDPINICKEAFIEIVCNKTQLGWSEQVPLQALRQSTSWKTEPKLIPSPKPFFFSFCCPSCVCPMWRVPPSCVCPGGGYYGNSWWGVCRPALRILTLFQTTKCHFLHPFSELVAKRNIRVYIERNHVIIAEIRTPTKRFLSVLFTNNIYN